MQWCPVSFEPTQAVGHQLQLHGKLALKKDFLLKKMVKSKDLLGLKKYIYIEKYTWVLRLWEAFKHLSCCLHVFGVEELICKR